MYNYLYHYTYNNSLKYISIHVKHISDHYNAYCLHNYSSISVTVKQDIPVPTNQSFQINSLIIYLESNHIFPRLEHV